MLSKLSNLVLKMMGWKLEKNLPPEKKFVVIAAPHTSNWDFLFFLLYVWAIGHKIKWGGKHTLFKKPFGVLLKKVGGIPIDRRQKNNFVDTIVEEMNRSEEFVITLTPEGTRSRAERWKTGFYFIAKKANVPVALGYIDYEKKHVGIAGYYYPSDNLENDLKMLSEFYEGKVGKKPQHHSEVKF